MSKQTKIVELIKKNNGIITGKQLKENNIEREYLSIMNKESKIERVSRGVYIDPNVFEDNMFNTQYKFKRGVFSHLTALYLHGLSDRTPFKYTMTFPRSYNTTNAIKLGVNVYRVIENKYNLGIEKCKTNSGNYVSVYSVERTLCDITRFNSRVDKEIIISAYNLYSKRKKKDLNKLYFYAKKFKVYSKVKSYIEVLLWWVLLN